MRIAFEWGNTVETDDYPSPDGNNNVETDDYPSPGCSKNVETDDYPSPRVIALWRRIIIRLYARCGAGAIHIALLLASVCAAQDRWGLEKPHVWARDGEAAVTLVQDGDAHRIRHTGKRDFSFGGFARIGAQYGDVFEVSCEVRVTDAAPGARAELSAVLRDADGKEMAWTWGAVTCPATGEWSPVKARFAVPRGKAKPDPNRIGPTPDWVIESLEREASVSVEPRITGWAAQVIEVRGMAAARTGALFRNGNSLDWPRIASFENKTLRVDVDNKTGEVSVTDKDTGRIWAPLPQTTGYWLKAQARTQSGAKTDHWGTETWWSPQYTLVNPQDMSEFNVRLHLVTSNSSPELEVTLEGKGAMRPLAFPAPFATRPGDRLIVPMNEGLGYPVDEEHTGLWRMYTYGGHGLCMAFFGVVEDATGAGWMAILETPDDGAMDVRKGAGGLWQAGVAWDPCKGEYAYPRKVRFVFFDKGGHVAMCKRYREHAQQTGLLKTFTEKAKANPNIDLLIGAANIWSWDGKTALAAEMQAAGMGRLIWSAGGTAEEVKAMNAMPGILTGRYDIYQDIMDPANFDKIRHVHGDWVTEAFPHDINWAAPGVPRTGWEIERKDGDGMIPCAVICDAKALPYARKRIAEELKAKPYRARFLDTTVAAPWFECWHPDHPMTRTDSKRWKMELLGLVSGEFGLVCGSETGHDASVPFCDYFEGMLSLGNYRVPDSGRRTQVIWDEVPENVMKYQVGEKYRLPLWELVYHDCVVAQWYWGDYNNKLPAIWRKRDLFNALYGTPPMYMLTRKMWDEQKDRFVASYKTAATVARATGYSEMTDHRILTPDRAVQQTAFANGTTVTVNFGAVSYTMPDCTDLRPMEVKVERKNRE